MKSGLNSHRRVAIYALLVSASFGMHWDYAAVFYLGVLFEILL